MNTEQELRVEAIKLTLLALETGKVQTERTFLELAKEFEDYLATGTLKNTIP